MLVLLLLAAPAKADEPPPLDATDPAYPGGRVPAATGRNELLVVPRLVLSVPRLALRAIALPVQGIVVLNGRYRIYQNFLDALTSQDQLIGVRLAFDFVLDYRMMFGLSFFDEKIFGPHTSLHAKVELGGPTLVVADLVLRPLPPQRRVALDLEASYVMRDDQIFQAIPSLTPPSQLDRMTRYSIQSGELRIRPRVQLTHKLSLLFGLDFAVRRFGDGRASSEPAISQIYCVRIGETCVPRSVDERLVPGFNAGTQLVRPSVALHLDTFNRPTRTSAGVRLDLGADYSQSLTDASGFFRVAASAELAVNLWQSTHVLLLRAQSHLVLPLSGQVPFSELTMLGGADNLRGFRGGRFRDFSSLLFTAEYRWPIWMWADASLFVDYGGVAGRTFDGLSFRKLYPDIGVGIRMRTSQHVYAGLQFAYGFPDGSQFYFTLGSGTVNPP